MPKAIISNRILFRPNSEEHLKQLMKALTYKIEEKGKNAVRYKNQLNRVEIIRNYRMLPNGVISIPQGRLDLIPNDYDIEDKRAYVEEEFPDPLFPLRDSQQPVYDAVEDTCLVNALVGWGKTFTALWIAKKLGQKTIVITHTTALRDQWVEEVEKLYGFTPGIIGSGKFELDCPIIVSNVQTLTKHATDLGKEFGTLVLDECHHVPATTFSNIVDQSYARYRIGLSGTLKRKDGKHIVLKDYFGSTIHQPPQSHTINPTIKILNTGIRLFGDNWAQKINNLLYDDEYQALVAAIAKTQINAGHKVLIVAERVEFLNKIKEYLGSDCVLITGETDFEQRKALIDKVSTGEASCIAGSRQIFAEGISVNVLSCLILCSPTSNDSLLEQLIGRVQRLHEDKLDPVVFDLNFSGNSEKSQNDARLGFYISKGWNIERL